MFAFLPFLHAQEKVSVTAIEVWAKVVDSSGEPVRGLKQEDFEMTEDGQPVSLTCFEEAEVELAVPPAAASASQSEAPPAPQESAQSSTIPAKRVVLFLDLFDTSQAEFQYIKPKLEEFLKDLSSTKRSIMIAGVLPDRRTGVFLPFTTDAAKVLDLIGKVRGNAMRDSQIEGNQEELRKYLVQARHADRSEQSGDAPASPLRGAPATPNAGVSVEDILRGAFQLAYNFARQDSETTRFCLRALENMGSYLAPIAGRDHIVIIFVSGGFSMDPGRRYFDIVERTAEDLREQVDSPELAIFRKGESGDYRKDLENAVRKLNHLNLTLYTINTRGLITTDPSLRSAEIPHGSRDLQAMQEYGDTLEIMAEETGGVSFNNSQNFKLGFNTVIKDLDHQYVLCYSPKSPAKAGAAHQIHLNVKKPNLSVRYRQGYIE
jgi:VWFA-related protein